MKKLIILCVCCSFLFVACITDNSYTRVDLGFFSLITPPSLEIVEEGVGYCTLEGEAGGINLSWSFDQFSMKDMPARESGRKDPDEEIIISTKASLGSRRIWWNKTRRDNVITIRMTIPLDAGYIRAEGVSSSQHTGKIEKAIRSIVINDENYFINNNR